MKKIVLYPNKILRQKTSEITKVDAKLVKDIESLGEKLSSTANGAGLAAVQIGLDRRFFGIKTREGQKVNILINPKIIKTYGQKEYLQIVDGQGKSEDFLEGCLSFPNLFGTVKRHIGIEVSWQKIVGQELVVVKERLEGYESIVFQHELDHLNGVLFVDHIRMEGGKIYRQVGEELVKIGVEEIIVD